MIGRENGEGRAAPFGAFVANRACPGWTFLNDVQKLIIPQDGYRLLVEGRLCLFILARSKFDQCALGPTARLAECNIAIPCILLNCPSNTRLKFLVRRGHAFAVSCNHRNSSFAAECATGLANWFHFCADVHQHGGNHVVPGRRVGGRR